MYMEKYLSISQESVKEEVDNFDYIDTESIVYNEYCNYCTIMESTLDSEECKIMEAKIEVLQEIALKDIGEKFKKAWEWVLKQFDRFIDFIKRIIQRLKDKRMSRKINRMAKKYGKIFKELKGINEIKNKVVGLWDQACKSGHAGNINAKVNDIIWETITTNYKSENEAKLAYRLATCILTPSCYFTADAVNLDYGENMEAAISGLIEGLKEEIIDKNEIVAFDDDTIQQMVKSFDDEDGGSIFTKEYKEFIKQYPDCKRYGILCGLKNMKDKISSLNLNKSEDIIKLSLEYETNTYSKLGKVYDNIKTLKNSVAKFSNSSKDVINKYQNNTGKDVTKAISVIKQVFDKFTLELKGIVKTYSGIIGTFKTTYNLLNNALDHLTNLSAMDTEGEGE